jgi:putative transposase
MRENRIELAAGSMVLTDDGTAVVVHVDRAGVELRDFRGVVSFVEWPDLRTAQAIDGGDPTASDPPALRSLAEVWNRLDDEARTETLQRLGIVQEVETGYRHGHAELALPGEPSDLFDPALGTSLSERCRRMAERICCAPGLTEALNPRKDESHGCTEEVPGRAPGASDPDGRRPATRPGHEDWRVAPGC